MSNHTDITRDIARDIAKKIKSYETKIAARRVGYITSVADGIARISGLPKAAYMEILSFPGGLKGVAINLEEDVIGAMVLGDYLALKEGDEVTTTGDLLSLPVGVGYLGRVVTPLGDPIDGKGAINSSIRYPFERLAPGVIAREPVNTPLQTGLKAIDAMIPIGRGQRELIIGDRNTGKTAIVIDTVINQRKSGIVCIYVAIGQKASRVAHVVSDLARHKALDHTIIVSATAADPAAFQYLAPYAGCALGEYFMDKGHDALVIYDDLSKHAWAYRQISLVLRRPSGREAYPGDVFYLHSRLLERACKMSQANGGGSLTALPIVETLANDLSAYIPTNVISITDGQIYLESDLFYAGQRPAINVGLSVSRVGGAAQIKAMKKVAGNLRLDLAQYRELAAFAQFSTDVDEVTRQQIERGSRMVEILKQNQYQPMPVEKQIAIVWAGTSGQLDDVPRSDVASFERGFMELLETRYAKTLTAIAKEKLLTKETEEELKRAVAEEKNRMKK